MVYYKTIQLKFQLELIWKATNHELELGFQFFAFASQLTSLKLVKFGNSILILTYFRGGFAPASLTKNNRSSYESFIYVKISRTHIILF